MRQLYGYNDIYVMPDDLRAFAWSAPMRDLAAKVGLSDVGLKKLLHSLGVPTPPQGHWNRVLAGKPVTTYPKAPPRRPGEIGRIRIDARFAEVIESAGALPSSGPFASKFVPEDLDELREYELKALGRVGVPKSLDGAHRGLRDLLNRESRQREKAVKSGWAWDGPVFDNPVGRRRLRILNGIFFALSKRGHTGEAYERDAEIHARAIVGHTSVGLSADVVGKHRTVQQRGYLRPAPDLPASTPLRVRIEPTFDGKNEQEWHDDNNGKLESKIAPIVAAIIAAGEASFRRRLREAEQRAEQARMDAEKRRREKLDALNQQRVADLHRSGELLRHAQDIRSLVANVRAAMSGGDNVTADDLVAWEAWALGEADKIDPILSGQFRTHLRPMSLD